METTISNHIAEVLPRDWRDSRTSSILGIFKELLNSEPVLYSYSHIYQHPSSVLDRLLEVQVYTKTRRISILVKSNIVDPEELEPEIATHEIRIEHLAKQLPAYVSAVNDKVRHAIIFVYSDRQREGTLAVHSFSTKAPIFEQYAKNLNYALKSSFMDSGSLFTLVGSLN